MSDSLIEPMALAVHRQRRNLSRADLAARTSINERTIKGWELRDRRMGADDVAACARALGLTDGEELALHRWAASVNPSTREGAPNAS